MGQLGWLANFSMGSLRKLDWASSVEATNGVSRDTEFQSTMSANIMLAKTSHMAKSSVKMGLQMCVDGDKCHSLGLLLQKHMPLSLSLDEGSNLPSDFFIIAFNVLQITSVRKPTTL